MNKCTQQMLHIQGVVKDLCLSKVEEVLYVQKSF